RESRIFSRPRLAVGGSPSVEHVQRTGEGGRKGLFVSGNPQAAEGEAPEPDCRIVRLRRSARRGGRGPTLPAARFRSGPEGHRLAPCHPGGGGAEPESIPGSAETG